MTDPHELFADRMIHAYRRSGTNFVQSVLVAGALSSFLLTELPVAPVALWLVFLIVSVGNHSLMGKRLLAVDRRAMAGVSTVPLILFGALAGLGWGAGAAFLPFVSQPLQLLLILTLLAIGTVALPRMAALPAIHVAFMAGLVVPILIALVFVFGASNWMMVVVLLVIWGGLTNEARKAHADLGELYGAGQSLQAQAMHDKLTGIPNRRAFDITLEREWRRAERLKVPLSLIMIDIDFFKAYNDRNGHPAGDECLASVAKALVSVLRRANDLVARYGGEEFVALLFHMPRDDARVVAESMRRAVDKLRIPHPVGPAGVVTVSVGGATCIPCAEAAVESLLAAADSALYQAKAAGRNRVCWADGGSAPLI
ncbi:MAG: GGDEF domain-containing protein [Rhodocyclaceae bacterium]|nr:GGDEF domain-containing protein [Rhodocyclaceae bacterium]